MRVRAAASARDRAAPTALPCAGGATGVFRTDRTAPGNGNGLAFSGDGSWAAAHRGKAGTDAPVLVGSERT